MKDNNTYYYYLREIGGEPRNYPSDKNGWQKLVKTDILETTVTSIPAKATKVTGNDIPELIADKIEDEENIITTVYKETDNVYYVKKEEIVKKEEPKPEEEETEPEEEKPIEKTPEEVLSEIVATSVRSLGLEKINSSAKNVLEEFEQQALNTRDKVKKRTRDNREGR